MTLDLNYPIGIYTSSVFPTSKIKTTLCTRDFSHGLGKVQVIARNSDWFRAITLYWFSDGLQSGFQMSVEKPIPK